MIPRLQLMKNVKNLSNELQHLCMLSKRCENKHSQIVVRFLEQSGKMLRKQKKKLFDNYREWPSVFL